MEFDNVRQKIVLRTADRIEFATELMKWGAMGAKLQANSVPRLFAPFTAEMEIMVNPKTPFRDSHCIRAYPPDHRIYTEQELSQMTFEEFRDTMSIFGIKGRERNKMIEEYKNYLKKYNG